MKRESNNSNPHFEKLRKEIGQAVSEVMNPEIDLEDVQDLLDALDFMFSGKDRFYRRAVVNRVADEMEKNKYNSKRIEVI